MNLKPFQPGQSGNPGGRPALPPEIREMRRKNQGALIKLVTDLLGMTEGQAAQKFCKEHIKDASQLELAIQGLIEVVKLSGKGAPQAFKLLMEIAIGRIPDEEPPAPGVQVNVQNNQVVHRLTDEELDARIEMLITKARGNGPGREG